jgi:hypothetical protein
MIWLINLYVENCHKWTSALLTFSLLIPLVFFANSSEDLRFGRYNLERNKEFKIPLNNSIKYY